jgi:uncharacterized protein YfdQ (DUF2303 family)
MADTLLKHDIHAALDAGTALAKPIINPNPESKAAVLVPSGYQLVYLDREPLPIHSKGNVKMADASSFISYWCQESAADSRIYGNMNPLVFTAVLNDHMKANAGWRDYRCVYAPTHSKEWLAWNGRNRQPFTGNEAFAIWLEDNAIDVVKPDAAKMMDIALNMKVNQIQGFANAVRLADGDIQLTYSNEVNASAKAPSGGKIAIPEVFTIEIPVFEGLNARRYRLDARFRYRLSNGALTIQFELVRPHKVVEQAFGDLVDQIAKATKQVVLFGSPE